MGPIGGEGLAPKLLGQGIPFGTDYHCMGGRIEVLFQGQEIGAGEQAVLGTYRPKEFQRLLSLFPVILPVGQVVEPVQGEGGDRVCAGCGRVLDGFLGALQPHRA